MDLSVIIPTYNPEERLLSRTLAAVEKFNTVGLTFECIVVDNNSPTPISEQDYIKAFLERCPWAKVIVETQQGVAHARVAGIRASQGAILIYFDDDNEPCPEYLKVCRDVFEAFPHVGVWGAGNITASLLDPVPDWLVGPVRLAHNVREAKHIQYGLVPETWLPYYPIGMGMAIKRELAQSYIDEVVSANLVAAGRSGKSLASGEDCQMVWHALNKGFAAGIHPELMIDHLVPGRRSTVEYLKRVTFGTSSSYFPSFYLSHPHYEMQVRCMPPKSRKIFFRLLMTTLRQVKRRRLKLLPVEVALVLGEVIGQCRGREMDKPAWVFSLARRMNLID